MTTDISGWHSDRPIFRRLLAAVRPKVVFELGVWKGASLIHMTEEAVKLGLRPQFYAVDFWSEEVVIQGSVATFEQFQHNLRAKHIEDQVIAMRMQTGAAAARLRMAGITADLIYVDADHTYQGALDDMENYYPLLNKGGVMFGDDYTEIPDVKHAVREFCFRHRLIHSADYYHWELPPKP